MKVNKRKLQLKLESGGPVEGTLTPHHSPSITRNRKTSVIPTEKTSVTDSNRRDMPCTPQKAGQLLYPVGGRLLLAQQQAHPILCCTLLFCLQSFPASVSFPMSQLFASGGQLDLYIYSVKCCFLTVSIKGILSLVLISSFLAGSPRAHLVSGHSHLVGDSLWPSQHSIRFQVFGTIATHRPQGFGTRGPSGLTVFSPPVHLSYPS